MREKLRKTERGESKGEKLGRRKKRERDAGHYISFTSPMKAM